MAQPSDTAEWRHDYLTGRRVIVAGGRGNRPGAVSPRVKCEPLDRCPFCAGHEGDSPTEIARHRLPNSDGEWDVRVVDNLYPALQLHTPAAFGKHEVIVESSRHEAQFANLSEDQIALALRVWRDRLAAAREIPGIAYAQFFKNNGPAAGASLEHCHSQVLAMGLVPEAVREEWNRCGHYARVNGRSYFAEWQDKERADGSRVLLDSPSFLAFCPYVSRSAYEMVILPGRARPWFSEIDDGEVAELAAILSRLLRALGKGLREPDYNVILYQAPFSEGDDNMQGDYSWRLEIAPRTTEDAGFEWGTGCAINATPPERAAAEIRDSLSRLNPHPAGTL